MKETPWMRELAWKLGGSMEKCLSFGKTNSKEGSYSDSKEGS